MSRTISFEGRNISVPDDATDAEVAEIINATAPAPRTITSRITGAMDAVSRPFNELLMGGIRGVAGIGATLMAPGDALTGYNTRRADIEGGVAATGVDTGSLAYGTGKLGAEIAGTAAVGGILGTGAKALGASAPIVSALGSFGMSTGAKVAPGALPFLREAGTRAGAGAITGGASQAIINPDDAVTGAAFGAAIPFAASGVKAGAGYLKDLFTGQRAVIRGGKLTRDVAGPALDDIKGILAKSKGDKTAGQALIEGGAEREEMFALARLAASKGDPNVIRAGEVTDTGWRKLLLDKMAGGSSQEAGIAARREAKAGISKFLDPLRVEGADAANATTKYISELKSSTSELRDAAMQSVEHARKFYSAGQKAAAKAGNIHTVAWMPAIPDRYTYPFDLAKRANQAVTDAAGNSLIAGRSAVFAEKSLAETQAKGLAELSANPLFSKIDSLRNTLGDKTSPVITDTLDGLKKHIAQFVDEAGNINAYDLHGIRKNISAIVDKIYPTADAGLKLRAAGVIRKLVPTIDEGLRVAGGQKMVEYFDKFHKGMQEVSKMELFSTAQKMTDKQLVDLVRGNSPDVVEKIFGQGITSIQPIMGQQYRALDAIAKRLERNIALEARGTADPAQNALAKIIRKNTSVFKLPPLIDAKVAFANKALGKAEQAANEKMMDIIYKAMQTPKDALTLLNTLPSSQRSQALQILTSPGLAVPIRGMLTQLATEEQP